MSKAPESSYTPDRKAIGHLLALTEPNTVVPDWQRNYSWEAEQVEAFWNDLIYFLDVEIPKGKFEYFLGSLVIVNTENGYRRLLDGQQRLATCAILLSSIRDKPTELDDRGTAKEIQENYLSGYRALKKQTVHKLQLNKCDGEYFRKLVSYNRIGDDDYVQTEPNKPSHRLILSTREYFDKQLNSIHETLGKEKGKERLHEVANCLLERFSVIAIFSTDEDYAADVFKTLNDRGIGLAPTDLPKNLLLKRANEGEHDTIVQLFEDVFSFEKETQVQSFLRHFWTSNYGDVKSHALYKEMKTKIVESDIQSLHLTQSLANSAKTYRSLINATTSDEALNELLDEITEFGAKSNLLFPAILAVAEVGTDEEARIFCALLLNVFVRYSIIANYENSPFEKSMYEGSRAFRQDKNFQEFRKHISDLG